MLEENDLQAIALLLDQKLKPIQEESFGIKERLDKLASRSRVEELEGDIILLKEALKLMRLELEALKKAQ